MPTPNSDETRNEFLQRCMADPESRRDFPREDQRFAFCQSQWDRHENRGTDMNSEHKTLKVEVKELTENGEFEAIIATLGVIDSDEDIIERGAFNEGPVFIQPSHDGMALPLGKGRIEERGDSAVVVGKLNLDTQTGRDWYAHLKFDMANPPARQEWSFGYQVKESSRDTVDGMNIRRLKRLNVFEVSPVLLGAGIGTGTLAVKSKRLVDHADGMIEQLDDLTERFQEVKSLRVGKGKDLSDERKSQIKSITERLDTLSVGLKSLSDDPADGDDDDDDLPADPPPNPEDEQDPDEMTPEEQALADVAHSTFQRNRNLTREEN